MVVFYALGNCICTYQSTMRLGTGSVPVSKRIPTGWCGVHGTNAFHDLEVFVFGIVCQQHVWFEWNVGSRSFLHHAIVACRPHRHVRTGRSVSKCE